MNLLSLSTILAAPSALPMIDLKPTSNVCSSAPDLTIAVRPAPNVAPIASAAFFASPAISPKFLLKFDFVRRRSAFSFVRPRLLRPMVTFRSLSFAITNTVQRVLQQLVSAFLLRLLLPWEDTKVVRLNLLAFLTVWS